MAEKPNTKKNESSRPTEQKRIEITSKRPLAPFQQEAAPEFYPKEVIEAEPKGEESVGEYNEQLAEIMHENENLPHQEDKSRNAPDVTTTGAKSDNRDGALDGVSSRATQDSKAASKVKNRKN